LQQVGYSGLVEGIKISFIRPDPPFRAQATPTTKTPARIITLDLKIFAPKHSGNIRLFG
jgi:hypothetical protein